MSISGSFTHFKTDILNVSISKVKGKVKGSVNISFNNTKGKITKIQAQKITKKKKGSKTVVLRVQDKTSPKVTNLSVKIQTLAQQLGVTKKIIKEKAKAGTLEKFINDNFVQRSKVNNRGSSHQVVKKDAANVLIFPPKIKAKIRSQPTKLGLTLEDLENIEQYYKAKWKDLSQLEKPEHIKADPTGDHPLPRSLVYVPSGPRKGMYVLLKTKGGVGEVGLGSFNRATLCLHLETGKTKIFRSANAKEVSEDEIEVTEMALDDPKNLVGGVVVKYEGSWRPRSGVIDNKGKKRKKNKPIEWIPKELNVPKVGFIMDYIKGGELFDYIDKNLPLSDKEAVEFALKVARGVQSIHRIGLVHKDLKLENIFITNNLEIKIADFGFSCKKGAPNEECGTPSYVPPEIFSAIKALPSGDIWSLGCLLSTFTHAFEWPDYNGKAIMPHFGKFGFSKFSFISSEITKMKMSIFTDLKRFDTLDRVIWDCLNPKESDRPSAKQLVKRLKDILKSDLPGNSQNL